MDITLINRQKRLRLQPAKILPLIQRILRREGIRDARLSVVFVTDRTIQALNQRFLKRPEPTDVLAFDLNDRKKQVHRISFPIDLSPLKDKTEEVNTAFSRRKKGHYTGFPSVFGKEKASKKNKIFLEGEIIISTQTAVKNAKIFRTTPHKEVILYLIHGILHLLGYNDHTPQAARQMRSKEEEVFQFIRKKLKR